LNASSRLRRHTNPKESLTNESKITGNDSSFLKTLAEHIAAQLDERAFCVVFEDELERCWPSNPMAQAERNSEIHRFAESQGWSAAIFEGAFGTRAIFQRLESAAGDYEGSPVVPS
jgi:hypothetical protein